MRINKILNVIILLNCMCLIKHLASTVIMNSLSLLRAHFSETIGERFTDPRGPRLTRWETLGFMITLLWFI
jgi:hypothetical protein